MERHPGTGGGDEEELRQVVWLTESGSLPEPVAENAGSAEPAGDEAEARAELLARIEAAGVVRLGEIATVSTAGDEQLSLNVDVATTEAEDAAEEFDSFPWDDAMRWSGERADLHNAPVDEELG